MFSERTVHKQRVGPPPCANKKNLKKAGEFGELATACMLNELPQLVSFIHYIVAAIYVTFIYD